MLGDGDSKDFESMYCCFIDGSLYEHKSSNIEEKKTEPSLAP